jgi:hypothetical protein
MPFQAEFYAVVPEDLTRMVARSFYVSDTTGLEDARRAIDATREDWATEVELLRTAARFGGAFLGVCKDITDYE